MEYTIFFKKTNIVEQIYFTQRFKISLSDFRIEVRNLSHVLVTCPETGHGWQAKKALWTFVPCLTEVPTRGWTPKQHNEAHTQGQTVQLCHKLLLTGFSGHLMKAKKPLSRNFHTCTKYCNAALREGLTPGSVNSRELSAATSTSGEPEESIRQAVWSWATWASAALPQLTVPHCAAILRRHTCASQPFHRLRHSSGLCEGLATADTQPSVYPLTPSMTQPGLPVSR